MNLKWSIGDDESSLAVDRLILEGDTIQLRQGRGIEERVIDSLDVKSVDSFELTHESHPRMGCGVKADIRLNGDTDEVSLPVAELIEMRHGAIAFSGGASGERVPPKRVQDVQRLEVRQSLWGDPSWNVSAPTVE